jgi:hypothetical protein
MESPHPKPLEPPATERVTICWIVAIVTVAIFGPAWFAVLIFAVLIGGPSASRALTRKLGLDDRD